MKQKFVTYFSIVVLVLGITGAANAAFIDFTGGIAYLTGGGTGVPNNSDVWGSPNNNIVDYYEENGFKLDFIGDGGIIGNYYGGSNDVIHGHWAGGGYGSLTSIVVTKLDGTAFDLNYFELTSNSITGGGAADGTEQAWVNSSNGFSMLLPSDDWGWSGPNPQIFLDANFDAIDWFSFTISSQIACFGMDSFFIDEPAPSVPEPATMLLLGSGLIGLAGVSRKFRK